MRQIKAFVILTAAAGLVACASHAPAPAPAPAPAAAAGAGRAAAPATALAAQQKQTPTDFPGYRRVVANGKEMFCRNDVVTGSLIKQRTCVTRAQLEAMQKDSQQFLKDNQQSSRTCAATFGLGGNPCQQ